MADVAFARGKGTRDKARMKRTRSVQDSSHMAAAKSGAAVLARAASGATFEQSVVAMRRVADEHEEGGSLEARAAVSAAVADLLRGFAVGAARGDNGRRRELEHQAVDNYLLAAHLLKDATAAQPTQVNAQISAILQKWRSDHLIRHLRDAAELAYELSGGSTDELAFAIMVQEQLCSYLQNEFHAQDSNERLLCHLRLAQYKHFIGDHRGALEALTLAKRELESDTCTPEHIIGLQLTWTALHHLERYDEAIEAADVALACLETAPANSIELPVMNAKSGHENSRGSNSPEVVFRRARGDSLLRAGRVEEARATFASGAQKGMWLTEWQRPGSEYAGPSAPLLSQPFWNSHGPEFGAMVSILEENWIQIRDEGRAVFRDGGFDELSGQTKRDGETGYVSVSTAPYVNAEWHHLILYEHGFKHFKNCAKTPITCKVVESLSGGAVARNVHGHVKFSLMAPGIVVSPHCGPSNIRIRIHLGLDVPEGCTLKVGNISGGWREGSVTIMDDSFEHEVHNNADQPRMVLLIDALHPSLTAGEIAAMRPPQMGERSIAANLDVNMYANVARAHGIAQNWTTRDSDRMHAKKSSNQ